MIVGVLVSRIGAVGGRRLTTIIGAVEIGLGALIVLGDSMDEASPTSFGTALFVLGAAIAALAQVLHVSTGEPPQTAPGPSSFPGWVTGGQAGADRAGRNRRGALDRTARRRCSRAVGRAAHRRHHRTWAGPPLATGRGPHRPRVGLRSRARRRRGRARAAAPRLRRRRRPNRPPHASAPAPAARGTRPRRRQHRHRRPTHDARPRTAGAPRTAREGPTPPS